MTRLPTLSAKQLIRVLSSVGFDVTRQRGSHAILKHPDGRATVVPIHSGEDLGKGILRKILKDIDLSPDDFKKMVR